MDEESRYVKVVVLESMIEAQLVSSILEEEGLPFRIRSYHDTAYDGLFQFQKGWGEVEAPAEHKDEIEDIVRDVRSNHAE